MFAILAMVCISVAVYIVTTLLPLVYPRCPYVTPLTPGFYFIFWQPLNLILPPIFYTISVAQGLFRKTRASFTESKYEYSPATYQSFKTTPAFKKRVRPLFYEERESVLRDSKKVDGQLLVWLCQNGSLNPSVPPIIFDAVSGMSTQHDVPKYLRDYLFMKYDLENFNNLGQLVDYQISRENLTRAERWCRSSAILNRSFVEHRLKFGEEYMLDYGHVLCSLLANNYPDGLRHIRERLPAQPQRTGMVSSQYATIFSAFCIFGFYETIPHAPPNLHPSSWGDLLCYITRYRQSQDATKDEEDLFKRTAQLLCARALHEHYRSASLSYFSSRTTDDTSLQSHTEWRGQRIPLHAMPYGKHQDRLMSFVSSVLTSSEAESMLLHHSDTTPIQLWFTAVLNSFNDNTDSPDFLIHTRALLREISALIDWCIGTHRGKSKLEAQELNHYMVPIFNNTSRRLSRLVMLPQVDSLIPLLINILTRIDQLYSQISEHVSLTVPLNTTLVRLMVTHSFKREDGSRDGRKEPLSDFSQESYDLLLRWLRDPLYADEACRILVTLGGLKTIANQCRQHPSRDISDSVWLRLQTRAAFVISAFTTRARDSDSEYLCEYLSVPDIMVECCSIMSNANIGRYALDRHTSHSILHILDEWRSAMVALAKRAPRKFRDGWRDIFQRGTYQVSHQTIRELEECRKVGSRWIPPSYSPGEAALVLTAKAQYEWIEEFKRAVGLDKTDEFYKVYINLARSEVSDLPAQVLMTLKPQQCGELGRVRVEYLRVAQSLNEDLHVIIVRDAILYPPEPQGRPSPSTSNSSTVWRLWRKQIQSPVSSRDNEV